jgi:hypothetical protein
MASISMCGSPRRAASSRASVDLPPPLLPMTTIRAADDPIAMPLDRASFGTKTRPE